MVPVPVPVPTFGHSGTDEVILVPIWSFWYRDPPTGANNAGRDIGMGRRRGSPHLAGIQSGGETPDRRAGTFCFGRDGRAGNQEAEVGERGSGSSAAACQTGLQSATANAETSRPTPVAVRPASRKQQTPQQQR